MAMARHTSKEQTTFQKGNKVLLKSTNLKLPYPYWKLAPKWEGPFTIVEVLGPVTYKLNLPRKWRIHPIFHAVLLTAYWTTKEHGDVNGPGNCRINNRTSWPLRRRESLGAQVLGQDHWQKENNGVGKGGNRLENCSMRGNFWWLLGAVSS